MLPIGVQTAVLLSQRGIDEAFSLIGRCGFDFVDFSCSALDGSLARLREKDDPLHGVFDLPFQEIAPMLDEYRRAAASAHVRFGQAHAPYPLYWPGNDGRNRYLAAALEKCVAMCGALDCPYIIVHPAKLDDRDEEWRVNMALYRGIMPALKEHHVTCCLENMFVTKNGRVMESVCADPYEACDYIDELNDIAGQKCFAFCLDTGHALLTGRDIYTALMKLGSRVETLHIHDNDGRSDQHMAPYMGVLDWDRFIMGVRDSGYAGGLSFETFNVLNVFDPELAEEALRLIAATGHMFARRIAAD